MVQAELDRIQENKRRRMANELKSTTYQVVRAIRFALSIDPTVICSSSIFLHQINNPTKLKAMSKKQLQNIKKTSVTPEGQVALVSPWE